MKSLLEKVEGLDTVIRDLTKLRSRLRSGQVIDAWRELNRIIAYVEKEKEDVIKAVE